MNVEDKANSLINKINKENPLYEFELEYEVKCLPYARPRKGRYGNFYNPRGEYKKFLKQVFEEDIKSILNKPVKGEVYLELDFGIKEIENIKESKLKNFLANIKFLRPIVKPDIDNFMKPVLDALNKVLYEDDGQIVELTGRKFYSEEDYLHIKVTYREDKIKLR